MNVKATFHGFLLVVYSTLCLLNDVFCSNHGEKSTETHRLLLFSLDGFRWDLLNRGAKTPTFDKFKTEGVSATYGTTSEFISNTVPNHFTLVTGLHVESHGFVDNTLYDPNLQAKYVPEFFEFNYVNHPEIHKTVGEPIWVSNQLQKQEGRSGVIMWIGGESEINGVRPTRNLRYDESVEARAKMDVLMDWLTDETEPINLGVIYHHQPDILLHEVGPDSPLVKEMVSELDAEIGYLLQRLGSAGLLDTTDIILTSDHGFVTVSADKLIQMDEIVPEDWYTQFATWPGAIATIYPIEGKTDAVYSRLQEGARRTGHFSVYLREDIPERFHLKRSDRVPPIVAVADAGYSFTSNSSPDFVIRGNHGYDNSLSDMRSFFLAMGPSFKQGFAVDTFRNVDLYPLMCHIMGLRPMPHNGSMETVSQFLIDGTGGNYSAWPWTNQVLVFLVAVMLLVVVVYKFLLGKPTKPKHM